MRSDIIKKSEELYQSGNVQDAFRYYASCLWRGEEDNPELLSLWLEDKDLVAKAGEQAVCAFIASILLTIDRYEESLRTHLWALCQRVLEGITVFEDRQDTSDRYVVECNLYRHQKKPEQALEAILKGLDRGGTTSRYTFAGLTYLDLEKEEEAERYLALGLQSDPGNAAAYNDLGDYYFKKRRFRKAGECYYKVLEAGNYDDCSWAEPSWIFCCFMKDADPYEKERLALCAAADIRNGRARELRRMAYIETLAPNVDYLSYSSESIINALRSMRERGVTSGVTQCAVTCQESASSILAVHMGIEQICGQSSDFVLTSNKAQDPPMDQTVDGEGIILWDYADKNRPVPVVPRPSEQVSRLVGELAATDFTLEKWYAAAEGYAARLSAVPREELYGVMVFPPKQTDDSILAENWLFRVQFAAVCILARLSLHEIDRLCKGQLDWPIIPAFTLAAWLASRDASLAPWAEELLNMVKSRISRHNYCFFEWAYTCAAYLLPGKSKGYYTALWQWRQSLSEG
ncbi:MAG: hypothetical protein NC305_09685 [Lachnospiraceae bacterium]|nr:hypothetical protein [Butyrivibrio sp.]MCM1343608.1 hypothetical protein [Muribaculaceae bacterium]MCM1410802.1 hypothetical protein [Lachnospiraceae bacterium]